MAANVATKVLEDKNKEVCHPIIGASNASGRDRCKKALSSCFVDGNWDEACISQVKSYAQKVQSEDYPRTFNAYKAEEDNKRKTRNILIAVGGLTVVALGVAVFFAAKRK